MRVVLFHSSEAEPSRNLVALLGIDGRTEESVVIHNGLTVCIVSAPGSLEAGMSCRIAPTVSYKDSAENIHSMEFPYNWEAVKLWVDQIERGL